MRPPSPTTLDPLTRAERGAGSRPRAAPIRVVLAERDTCIRRDMRSLLHGSGHGLFEVVAETSDSAGAQRFAHAHQPCVVVLDLDLPGNERSVIDTIRSESPDARIVVLAMQQDAAGICDALRAGATGYVLKGRGREALAHAVRSAAAGYGYVVPAPAYATGPARGERRPGWPGASLRADVPRTRSVAGS